MRIKALVGHLLKTARTSIIVFYSFFMIGTLGGSMSSSAIGNGNVGVMVVSAPDSTQSWSSGIIAFLIYMLVAALITAQKDTRFLITRSVARKEIFVSVAIFLVPLAAIMAVLQVTGIYADGLVRVIFGEEFKGISHDIQSFMAPNMDNIFVFFMVSFSLMLSFGALSYLLGSFLGRWKVQTLGTLVVLGVALISCSAVPAVVELIVDTFKFMCTDSNSGVFIAIKQIVFAAIALLLAFPVMRGMTAAKQTQ